MKPDPTPDANDPVSSLSDLILKYDMARMVEEAETEFDKAISTHELVDQKSIGRFFNLKERLDARN